MGPAPKGAGNCCGTGPAFEGLAPPGRVPAKLGRAPVALGVQEREARLEHLREDALLDRAAVGAQVGALVHFDEPRSELLVEDEVEDVPTATGIYRPPVGEDLEERLGEEHADRFTLEACKVDLPELQGEPEDIAKEKVLEEATALIQGMAGDNSPQSYPLPEEVWRTTSFQLEVAIDAIEARTNPPPVNPFAWAPLDSGLEDN